MKLLLNEEEQGIANLVEEIAEHIVELQKNEEDPFAIYMGRLQAKFFQDRDQLKDRCLDGYRTLKKG